MTPITSNKKIDVNGNITEHRELVNRYTRAGQNGKNVKCPICDKVHRVYHFSWSGLTCNYCHSDVDKNDWLVDQLDTWRTPR